MSNRNEQMSADSLETRTGIRVLANNEVTAVAGASVWDAYSYGKETVNYPHWLVHAILSQPLR